MAAESEEFPELPAPEDSMFYDITLDDLSHTTFNDVMIEVRKCIHEGLPRYTLFTFRQANSEFSCHSNYYQGVTNYCLAVAFLCVLSLIIIAIYLLAQEHEDEDNVVSPVMMKRYRISLTASAIFIFLFTFIALAGIVLVQVKWRQINSKYTTSGLESVEYFYEALTTINVTIFEEVEKYKETMIRLSYVQSQASRIAQSIAKAAGRAYQAIKKQIRQSVLLLLDQVEEAREPMVKLLKAISGAISALKGFKVGEIVFLCGGLVVTLWTMGISFMILRGAFARCDTEITYMCRLACCTLVVWWIVAMVTVPATIAVADFCYTPRESGAEFAHYKASELSEQLVYYYLSCDGDNPIATYLSILAGVFYAMTVPFVLIFNQLKSVGVYQSEQVVQKLNFTKDLLNEALLYGCVKSKFLYDQASYETCNHVLLGLVLVAFAAPFIGLLLTFYVVIALKVRDAIEQSKDDICIPTEEKDDEEPDICDQTCGRGETPNIDRDPDEISSSGDTIRQKKEKPANKVVQLKNALGGVWRKMMAKGDQPEPTKSFQEETASKVVKNKVGPRRFGVWRALVKGDQPEPTESREEETASKVVQVDKKICPAPGGLCRKVEKEKKNEDAFCPPLQGDEDGRSVMLAPGGMGAEDID